MTIIALLHYQPKYYCFLFLNFSYIHTYIHTYTHTHTHTVAVLSAGPVGIGDGIGYINTTLVSSFCRSDGVLLSPSYSATPLDRMYGIDAPKNGELWQAHSVIGEGVWMSLLAVDIAMQESVGLQDVWPRLKGQYIYTASLGLAACKNGSAAAICAHKLSDPAVVTVYTGPAVGVDHAFKLYSLAPVEKNGWALLGEAGPVVAVSPMRFSSVTATVNGMVVHIIGMAEENVTIVFMTPHSTILTLSVRINTSGSAVVAVGV